MLSLFCLVSLHGGYVSVQYHGGFLPDMILLTQCYYHRGTQLTPMKRFLQPMIPPKRFDNYSRLGDAQKV